MSASLFIQLPISLILALILSKGVKGDNFFRTIYFIPVVISSMVIGQLWLKMFNSDYGVINTVIRYFVPEYEYSWLTKNAFMTVLIPSVWQYIGYHMIIFYAGIKSISTDYYEAAQIDGANRFKRLIYITLPALANTIITVFILNLAKVMNLFESVFVTMNNAVLDVAEVLQTYVYRKTFSSGNSDYGYTTAVGLFKSFVGMILVLSCNYASKKVRGRGIV